MSFWFGDNEERKLQIQQEKDRKRTEKKRAAKLAMQKQIDAEVERLMEENSPQKKQERLDALGNSSTLIQGILGGPPGNFNQGSLSGLRSEGLNQGIMSLSRSSQREIAERNSSEAINPTATVKAPRLNRPF